MLTCFLVGMVFLLIGLGIGWNIGYGLGYNERSKAQTWGMALQNAYRNGRRDELDVSEIRQSLAAPVHEDEPQEEEPRPVVFHHLHTHIHTGMIQRVSHHTRENVTRDERWAVVPEKTPAEQLHAEAQANGLVKPLGAYRDLAEAEEKRAQERARWQARNAEVLRQESNGNKQQSEHVNACCSAPK